MKTISTFLAFAGLAAAQIFPPGGGGGSGAANLHPSVAGPATSLAINITTLSLTAATLNTLVVQCWTGTGIDANGPTGTLTRIEVTLSSRTTTSVTANFSSSSNVGCVANSNGGAGATGSTGATGATGPAGPAPSGTGIVGVTSGVAGLAVAETDYVTPTGAGNLTNKGVDGASAAEIARLIGVTSAVQTQLNAKQATITTGTTGQYFRGDLSLATFPTVPTITGSAVLKGSSGNAVAALSADVYALWSGTCSASTFLRGDGACATPAGTISGSGTTGKIIKFTGSTAIGDAAAADVYALWSGTCSASTYLRGDGACSTPSGAGSVTSVGLVGTANQITVTGTSPITSSGSFTVSFPAGGVTLPGTTTGTFTGNVTGNVSGTAATITGALALANTVLTTRGDLLYTGVGPVMARLALGTNGQCLTSNGTDAVWGTCSASSGTVTSVGWTGGLVSVATATSTPAFTVAGTSGGVPYFSSASTWASSAALTANGVMLGGGAGAAPTVTAANSTTTNALFATAGAPAFRAIVAGDIPTLNQNTTGSAATWTTARNLAGNSVNGSANVAFANQFIVQGTTDSGLSAAQFLGALATGIVKNTTTTGVLSIAAAGTDYLTPTGSAASLTSFPTFNQNTTGSAAMWTTARLLAGNSVNGSANVAFSNKFIVQGTSDSGLSAAQFLGSLGTGVVKNTTTTGVLSLAASSDIIGLWASGACSGFLKSDNTCSAAGASSVFTGSRVLAVTFSATPTFSLADATNQSPVRIEFGALTANVTSVTFSNKSAGAQFSLVFIQDATGGRTVAYGASAANTCIVSPTASKTTTQFFEIAGDGTTVNGTGCVSDDPLEDIITSAAPSGSPASGHLFQWADSTNQGRWAKDSSGNLYRNYIPTTCSNQVVTAMPSSGTPTCTTITSAYVSNTIALTGADINTSSVVAKVNGTSVPTNSAADQVIVTTASATGAWKSIADCDDTGGNHLNYDTTTHAFSCGTSGGGGGSGTVNSGTASHLGYYATSTTAITDMPALTFDGTNTVTAPAATILNFSAITGANAFKIPVQAGAVPTADGAMSVDSTGHIVRAGLNGTTYALVPTATTNVNNGCAGQVANWGSPGIGCSGIAGGDVVLASSAAGAANQICTSNSTDKTCVYKSAADIGISTYVAGGGTANAQTATLVPAATSLTAGLTVRWKPTAANTSSTTLTVNGTTTKNLTKCGTTALAANDLTTAAVATATYDGTQYQLLNPQAATCGASGGGTAFDPMDLTTVWFREDFLGAIMAYSNSGLQCVGAIAYSCSAASGSITGIAGVAGHPGIIRMMADTTGVTEFHASTGTLFSNSAPIIIDWAKSPKLTIIARTNATSNSNWHFGFSDTSSITGGQKVVIFKNDGTANYHAYCSEGGGSNTDLGVAADTNFHTFKIEPSATTGQMKFSIDATVVDNLCATANLPTSAQYIFMAMTSTNASAQTVDIDALAFSMTR